jgi:hypothetical protein
VYDVHSPCVSKKYGALWVGVIDADALVTVGDADSVFDGDAVTGRLGRCDGVGRGCTNVALTHTNPAISTTFLYSLVVIEIHVLLHVLVASTQRSGR